MADIELIVKIPEEVRVAITRMGLLRIPNEMQKKVDRAIQRGTPLPKGHGRLIDARKVYKNFYCRCLAGVANEVLNETPTIIEADKEQE